MTAINYSTVTALEDLHNIAGIQFLPLLIHHTLLGYAGKNSVLQQLLNPFYIRGILAVGSEPLLEGLDSEKIPAKE